MWPFSRFPREKPTFTEQHLLAPLSSAVLLTAHLDLIWIKVAWMFKLDPYLNVPFSLRLNLKLRLVRPGFTGRIGKKWEWPPRMTFSVTSSTPFWKPWICRLLSGLFRPNTEAPTVSKHLDSFERWERSWSVILCWSRTWLRKVFQISGRTWEMI